MVSLLKQSASALGAELSTVPMEEIVRAFNWVIEKGWVSVQIHIGMKHELRRFMNVGILLGDLRMVRDAN